MAKAPVGEASESRKFGFGERLKKAREARGLTQADLGKGAGEHGRDANKQSISDWEAERYYPKVDQLRVMCLRLNASLDDLVFGDVKRAAAMAKAESAIQELTPEQRADLIKMMAAPPATDEQVEERMPATKTLKKSRKRHGDSGPDSGMGELS